MRECAGIPPIGCLPAARIYAFTHHSRSHSRSHSRRTLYGLKGARAKTQNAPQYGVAAGRRSLREAARTLDFR